LQAPGVVVVGVRVVVVGGGRHPQHVNARQPVNPITPTGQFKYPQQLIKTSSRKTKGPCPYYLPLSHFPTTHPHTHTQTMQQQQQQQQQSYLWRDTVSRPYPHKAILFSTWQGGD
jgi:hypothetical protein